MLSNFVAEYSLSGAQQGLISTSQGIGSMVSLIIAMLIAGRLKKTTVVTLSLFFIIFICLFISVIPPFVVLALLYGLLGIVIGLFNALNSSLISDMHSPKTAPKYMSLLHGVFGMGGIAGPIAFLFLMNAGFSWNQVFMFISALCALMFALYYFMSRKAVKVLTFSQPDSKFAVKDFLGFFKSRNNLLYCASIGAYSAHQAIVVIFITMYITTNLMSVGLGALSLSLYWVGIAAARLLTPKFKLHPKTQLVLGCLLAGLTLAVGLLSNNALILTVCVLISGFFGGSSIPLIYALACSENSTITLIASTIVTGFLYIFQAATPVFVAYISSIFTTTVGMYISVLLALLCSLTSFFIKKRVYET